MFRRVRPTSLVRSAGPVFLAPQGVRKNGLGLMEKSYLGIFEPERAREDAYGRPINPLGWADPFPTAK